MGGGLAVLAQGAHAVVFVILARRFSAESVSALRLCVAAVLPSATVLLCLRLP